MRFDHDSLDQDNLEPRDLFCFCLDVSASMSETVESPSARAQGRTKLDLVNESIAKFLNTLKGNARTREAAEVAFLHFADDVDWVDDDRRGFFRVHSYTAPPKLEVFGGGRFGDGTNIGRALDVALDAIRDRFGAISREHLDAHQPKLLLITDGHGNHEYQDAYTRAAERCLAAASEHMAATSGDAELACKPITVRPIAISAKDDNIRDLRRLRSDGEVVELSAFELVDYIVALSMRTITGRSAESIVRVDAGAATAPAVTTHPGNQTVCSGGSASFNVAASGTPSPTFQWRRGTTNLVNGGNTSGATTATLIINPVGTADAATNYNCVVTNSCGSATSNNASLTVNSANQSQPR